MSDDTKHKRLPPISYRPPKELRAELYARQLRSGLSMNAFITQAIFESSAPRKRRPPQFGQNDLAQLLALAGQLYDKFDETEPSDGASRDRIDSALEELATIRNVLLNGLGRSP